MPSKKRKYNARFPPGRIKKIMQTDEEVGKVAQAVPIIISRTLELFAHSLLTKTVHITNTRQAKTLSPAHMKQCILSENRFDFLRDLVKNIPDATGMCENNAYALGGHALALPPPPMFSSNTIIAPAILPRSSTAVASNIVPKEEPSCAQAPPKRHSIDNGDKTESIKVESIKAEPAEPAVEDNETVFTCDVPKSKTPVPITFNASQPNFYTELNSSNSSDNVPISNSYIKPVSNFSRTANIDEDYDT